MPFLRFPDQPPVPVSAVFDGQSGSLVITFDRLLQDGVIDEANWFLRVENRIYAITAAQVSAGKVVLMGTQSGSDPGPDVVSYSPPPFDVVAMDGAAAEAFSDFPVV